MRYFKKKILPIVMLIGIGTVNLKADFETDLHNMLSLVRFSQENHEDPLLWVECYRCYKAYKVLYKKFQNRVSEIVGKYGAFRERKTIAFSKKVNTSNGSVKDVFCFLRFGRDLYRCVSDYMDEAYDLFADLNTIDGIASTECYHAFVCRMFGLTRCCIREFAETVGTEECFHMTDQKPCKKILARLMETFAKGDAYKELASKNNDSSLVQNVNIFQKSFETFGRRVDAITADVRSEVDNACSPNEKLRIYVETTGDLYKEAVHCLEELSGKLLNRLKRMRSILGKISEEDFNAFSKNWQNESSDVRSGASEKFRLQEKKARKQAQKGFKEKKIKQAKRQYENMEKMRVLKRDRKQLRKLLKSMQMSDETWDRKKLEDEIMGLSDEIKNLLSSSLKMKREIERKAAKKYISKEDRKAALFVNYESLPGKCDGYLKTFFYYDVLMRNVCWNKVDQITALNPWYDVMEIEKPILTEDFEEEYNLLTGKMRRSPSFVKHMLSFDIADDSSSGDQNVIRKNVKHVRSHSYVLCMPK